MSYTPRHSATPRDSITANPSATHRDGMSRCDRDTGDAGGSGNLGHRYGCIGRRGPPAPELPRVSYLSMRAKGWESPVSPATNRKPRPVAHVLLIPRAPKFCRIARPLIPWCKNHGFRSPRFRPGARPQQQAHGRAVASAAARTLHPLHLAMFQEPWQVAP